MKTTHIILLSGLLLLGCSQIQPAVTGSAIDLVQTDKFITLRDGYVLYVQKRDGASLDGIKIIKKTSDGVVETILSAETGTVASGSVESAADESAVRLTLKNVRIESGAKVSAAKELTIVLHKP